MAGPPAPPPGPQPGAAPQTALIQYGQEAAPSETAIYPDQVSTALPGNKTEKRFYENKPATEALPGNKTEKRFYEEERKK